ncbi:hypothetical protein B0O80DRAFT_450686 [Mortierella sp. GBAus27b]|nr:hypothetical protein B0O80DRAFT_450686 [Mortierella sp. GBAus27b]
MSASTTGILLSTAPSSPLNLNEIRELIGHYLSRRDHVCCIRVNRAWHASFLPFVWKDVVLRPNNAQNSTFYDTLVKYGVQHVQNIRLFHNVPYCALKFPNLQAAHLQELTSTELTTFFSNNPTVTRVTMNVMYGVDWKALATLPNVRTAEIRLYSRHEVLDENEHLWNLCTRLEVLVSPFHNMVSVPDNLQCLNLKEIQVTNGFYWTSQQVEFLRRCPNLQVLKLGTSKWTRGNNIVQAFVRLAGSGTWTELHSLQWYAHGVSDEHVADILESMPWCDEWEDGGSSFGPRSLQALERHFRTLTVLTFEDCNNVTSEMVQEIMSSCPLLKVLNANRLEARHIAQGKTWICTSLTTLRVFIDFEEITARRMRRSRKVRPPKTTIIATNTSTTSTPTPANITTTPTSVSITSTPTPANVSTTPTTATSISATTTTMTVRTSPPSTTTETRKAAKPDEVEMERLHRRVFEQLSLLSKLEILSFGRYHDLPPYLDRVHVPGMSLDLRLCSGLGILGTLTQLRILRFQCTMQRMGTEDVLWMNEHWPRLREVFGIFNRESSEVQTAVKGAFRLNVAVQVVLGQKHAP